MGPCNFHMKVNDDLPPFPKTCSSRVFRIEMERYSPSGLSTWLTSAIIYERHNQMQRSSTSQGLERPAESYAWDQAQATASQSLTRFIQGCSSPELMPLQTGVSCVQNWHRSSLSIAFSLTSMFTAAETSCRHTRTRREKGQRQQRPRPHPTSAYLALKPPRTSSFPAMSGLLRMRLRAQAI